MRLSRTDLVPVLAIVAGGAIGASLSFSFLGSRSDDVVFVAAPVAPSATKEMDRRLEPLARETAEQQLAGFTTLEVREGYLNLLSIKVTARPRLLEMAETYVRLSDFRDEEQQRLPEVAETYIRFSDLRDEEQQRLPEVAETYIRWSDVLQFRNQVFLEGMERQVEVERRRVEFAIANDVTVLPNP